MPGFKIRGGARRPNPLVQLPAGTDAWLGECTAVRITHEHPEHLDHPALNFIRERSLPVFATRQDAENLRRKRLSVQSVVDGAFGARVEVVPGRHGRGLIGFFLGPVHGFYFDVPDEPRVFLSGDAILGKALLATIVRLNPDIVVAPDSNRLAFQSDCAPFPTSARLCQTSCTGRRTAKIAALGGKLLDDSDAECSQVERVLLDHALTSAHLRAEIRDTGLRQVRIPALVAVFSHHDEDLRAVKLREATPIN
jgi:hypothetical protein